MSSELKEKEQANSSSLMMGGALIVVGIVLVVSRVSGFSFENWWVLFMAIPAFFMLQNVWGDYQDNGRLTSRSIGSLIGSLAIGLTAVTFLVDSISWGELWPIGFVFAGLAILLSNR